ncbi:uncharacterized protein L201_003646 [Kwoniella dendrophila CBS 6074]|uniref:Galactose oxidase n=1 Tax=Kwoniella dendrophila CBS 6074 TaxID=1295534 RepID=A0AAX4JVA4_9TREE
MSIQVEGKRRRKRQYTTGMENIIQHGQKIALLVLLSTAQTIRAVDADGIIPRWGHASAYIPSPPTLIIQGGKTDPSSSYTYTSSPNTAETIILPLSNGFSTSSPPFTSVHTPSAPTSAWHTLTPLSSSSSSDGSWELLSFGGDGGTNEAVQTGSNSAWILTTHPDQPSVNFTRQPAGNSQPMRRIHHSATSLSQDGKMYIIGGLKDDGSGATFADTYSYDSSTSSFSTLPNLPVGLYHHTSMLLPNGTLLALGGAYTSPSTGGAAVQPYSTVYSLDTTSSSPIWTEVHIGDAAPDGRRGASLVLNDDGSKAFLFGGANARLGEVYSDGWEFDTTKSEWIQVANGSQGAGPRYDHSAVGIGGNRIAIFGGYGNGAPADTALHIWDISSNSWISDFTPVSQASVSSSATASSSGKSALGSGTSTLHGTPAKTESASGSTTIPFGVTSQPSSDSAPSSTSSAPTDAGAHSHPITTPIKIGLILGIIAFVGILFSLCLWRYLRRRKARRAATFASSWPDSGAPPGRTPSRPYGSREKGGEGLMEDINYDPEKTIEGGYEAWGIREKGASIGLGMGAIGATLHSISSKFTGRGGKEDPYAELHDESANAGESEEIVGGPLRKSTRRIGDGIRLLGPRPMQREKSLYYSPSLEKPVRKASIIRNSRIDMFKEEDSDSFSPGPSTTRRRRIQEEQEEGEDDWMIASDESGNNWKSAKSILNDNPRSSDNEEDPFDDRDDSFDDDAPILPPLARVRGGPVPTPHESRSDLGTLDEIASMSNPYSEFSRQSQSELSKNPYSDISQNRLSNNSSSMDYHLPSLSPSDPLDLAGLLVPPPTITNTSNNRYSQNSIPISARSGKSSQSNTLSDAEEGIITEAQSRYLHSQSPTLVSPTETPYIPIKRSESFFRRMAAGGITSLLSSTKSTNSQKRELDIRDPAPQPTLWPVISKDELNSPENNDSPISPNSNDRHPPTSWKGDSLVIPSNQHGQGPSLSSLNSARSMRDMILVQRETTESSLESEAIIENERSSSPIQHVRGYSDDTLNRAEQSDSLSPLPSETSTSVIPTKPDGVGIGHQRDPNGLTTTGLDTPEIGEIVFNGADFASPPLPILPTNEFGTKLSPLPKQATPEHRNHNDSENENENENTPKSGLKHVTLPITPKRIESKSLNTQVIDENALPPSGSPVPSPLVKHRRPVKDVVNSINKRGSQTPFSLLSPLSNYSPVVDRVSSINQHHHHHNTAPSTSPILRPSLIIEENDIEGDQDPFGTPKAKPKRPITIHGSPTSSGPSSSNPIDRITSPPLSRTDKRISSGFGSDTTKRPTTMWEVIKRDQLKIANPDNGDQRKVSNFHGK